VKRIVVLGNGGSGKSQLARELSRRTGLPVVHLDPLFWRPGWKAGPRADFRRAVDEAAAREGWIIDGNFVNAGDTRFDRADTAIFLDLPRRICITRAVRRFLREWRRRRPDLPEGCQEGLDWHFVRWMWNFDRDDRPQILERLRQSEADVVHLRSPIEVERFLASVRGP
jgi:adenylate kinase family enzyme